MRVVVLLCVAVGKLGGVVVSCAGKVRLVRSGCILGVVCQLVDDKVLRCRSWGLQLAGEGVAW